MHTLVLLFELMNNWHLLAFNVVCIHVVDYSNIVFQETNFSSLDIFLIYFLHFDICMHLYVYLVCSDVENVMFNSSVLRS